MAAQADSRIQDLQKMNAAAKESVNIFDKLFARARLNEKDSAKLQNGQRQLYQELADQERKLSMGSPAQKPIASPLPHPSRPSLDLSSSAFSSPLPNGVASLRKDAQKPIPKTPTLDVAPSRPLALTSKGTPKASASSSLKPSAARRPAELRRESDRFGSSPVAPKPRDDKHAPHTPKKARDLDQNARAPSTPSTPTSAARTPSVEERNQISLSVRPASSAHPTTPAPATTPSSLLLATTTAAAAAAPSTTAQQLPLQSPAPVAPNAELEAENKRLQRALRAMESKYEKLRAQHRELLAHSLDIEEQLVNCEAEKVSIIATCMRIVKEADSRASKDVSAPAAPPEDGGWLADEENIQESLQQMGADVTVPEHQP